MKYPTLFFCFLLLLLACDDDEEAILGCLPVALQQHVIGFYPFHKGSLQDFSHRNNNLRNARAVATTDRNGNAQCAYQFNKNSNTFLEGDGSFTNDVHKRPFSVSFWYKPMGYRDGGDWEGLIVRQDTMVYPSNYFGYALSDCRIPAVVFAGKAITNQSLPPTNCDSIKLNSSRDKWFHFAATYDGASLQLYINGQQTQDTTRTYTINANLFNRGPLLFGYRYTGVLDDIIFFDKQLTETEVLTLYNLAPCCE